MHDRVPPVHPSTTRAPSDGLPAGPRVWAMLAILLGSTMAVLDASIANIALPTIAGQLRAMPAETVWVVNGYQLAIVASLLPLAALGELIGYKRVYGGGLALFTLGSLFCALSHSLPLLVAARLMQGLRAAGVMSVNGALIRHIWPLTLLGRGVGMNALIVSMAAALGPSTAAAVLAVASWEWLFVVNVPLGLMTAWPAAIGLIGPLAGRLSDRVAPSLLGGIGMGLLAIGSALLALMPDQASIADIVWRIVVCGVGFGLFQAPNNRVMLGTAPRDRTGAASGMLATARLTGQTVGATLAAVGFRLLGHDGERLAMLCCAGLAAMAAALSAGRFRRTGSV